MAYSTRKAAEQLGVNINTLLRWINLGKVKARKAVFGNGWIFTDEDIRAIRKWREAPLAILDLAKVEQAPGRVTVDSAKLRPDLDLYGAPFKGTYPYGPEHPYALIGKWQDEALRSPPWSILESSEYIEALEAHRSKPSPVAAPSPIQEATQRLFEQFQAEQENEK